MWLLIHWCSNKWFLKFEVITTVKISFLGCVFMIYKLRGGYRSFGGTYEYCRHTHGILNRAVWTRTCIWEPRTVIMMCTFEVGDIDFPWFVLTADLSLYLLPRTVVMMCTFEVCDIDFPWFVLTADISLFVYGATYRSNDVHIWGVWYWFSMICFNCRSIIVCICCHVP